MKKNKKHAKPIFNPTVVISLHSYDKKLRICTIPKLCLQQVTFYDLQMTTGTIYETHLVKSQ